MSEPRALQTHLSNLFLTDDRVFKQLRPVTLPFVDHADLDVRLAAAQREHELNRFWSPSVHVGTADVVENGELVDRLIVMRRLDAADELTGLVGRDGFAETLHRVARRIASAHASLEPVRGEAAEVASVESISTNWSDNARDLHRTAPHLEPSEIERVAAMAESYLTGRAALFQERIDHGWIRACHGDLRAEHVFVTDQGIELIDCVAFDDRYRIGDVLGDIGFLAMDLDRLHGPAAAVALLKGWTNFTNEHHPSSLAHFYVAYRAHVRAKIAALRFQQSGDTSLAREVAQYHEMARRHLQHARQRVILVGGGAGAGKSTIADAVSKRLGAVWLRSDEIRKDIAKLGPGHHIEGPDEGVYSAEVNAKVLAEMIRQTVALVRHGESVVLDATWRQSADRDAVEHALGGLDSTVISLECIVPAAVARERIARRMASPYNPSDATPELVDHLLAGFEPWPASTEVHTDRPIDESVDEAMQAIVGNPSPSDRFIADATLLRRMAAAWLLQRGAELLGEPHGNDRS